MSEKSKEELLREKLQQYFDSKLTELTTKFQNDVNTLEKIKFNYYDNVILPFRETQKIEITEPPEKPEKKEEFSLKKMAQKSITSKKTPNFERTKTPLRPAKVRDFGFKEKTVDVGKKTAKFINTTTQKNIESRRNNAKNYNTTMNNATKEKPKTPYITKSNRDRNSKSAFKKGNMNKNKTNTLSLKTPVKKSGVKKIFEDKKQDKKEEKLEKPVVKKEIKLKDKTLIKIPENIKNNNNVIALYLMLKGNYLSNDKKFNIISNNPLIYKSFDSSLKFLLEPKKQKLTSEIKEIESFFSEYNELDKYLSRVYAPSKTSINSLVFCTVQEVTNFIKKENIPPEITNIFRLLYIIIDENLDENLSDKELIEKFVTEILEKNGVQDLKGLLIGYVEKHKEGILNMEKIQKIEKLIENDKKVITSADIMKINRPISYLTLFTKEFYEFMEVKIQNGIYYYTVVEKNMLLQKYRNELAIIDYGQKAVNN